MQYMYIIGLQQMLRTCTVYMRMLMDNPGQTLNRKPASEHVFCRTLYNEVFNRTLQCKVPDVQGNNKELMTEDDFEKTSLETW